MCINKSVGTSFLALLLIFGIGKPDREPVDKAKSVSLRSRIPCDGYTAPEDDVQMQVTFSSGTSARQFVVSRFQKVRKVVRVARVLLMVGGAAYAISQKLKGTGKDVTVDQWPDVAPKPS